MFKSIEYTKIIDMPKMINNKEVLLAILANW